MGDVRVHGNVFGPAESTTTLQEKVDTKHQAATRQLLESLTSAAFMSFDYGSYNFLFYFRGIYFYTCRVTLAIRFKSCNVYLIALHNKRLNQCSLLQHVTINTLSYLKRAEKEEGTRGVVEEHLKMCRSCLLMRFAYADMEQHIGKHMGLAMAQQPLVTCLKPGLQLPVLLHWHALTEQHMQHRQGVCQRVAWEGMCHTLMQHLLEADTSQTNTQVLAVSWRPPVVLQLHAVAAQDMMGLQTQNRRVEGPACC